MNWDNNQNDIYNIDRHVTLISTSKIHSLFYILIYDHKTFVTPSKGFKSMFKNNKLC